MKMYDNSGNVVAEQNTGITKEGTTISTNTMYQNGRPIVQNISVRDNNGNVRTETIIGKKLQP